MDLEYEFTRCTEENAALRAEVERLMADIVTGDNRNALLKKVAEAAQKYLDCSLCCCDMEVSDVHTCGEDELRAALAAKEG